MDAGGIVQCIIKVFRNMPSTNNASEQKEISEAIVVSETHWDREWYQPFQEFRAKLVILFEELFGIFERDPRFKNFTTDGQACVIEDLLAVHPEYEDKVRKYAQEGKLSIGPFYVLPDNYVVSQESHVHNLLLGHDIANKYGNVMKAGYIPDPFGHIAQMPQILAGFDIPTLIFMRGLGNEFEEQHLGNEFWWWAPDRAAKVMGEFLIRGYGSVAGLPTGTNAQGLHLSALNQIREAVNHIGKTSATPTILLNSGTDHLRAQPELPDFIDEWNADPEINNGTTITQGDFVDFYNAVMARNPDLKDFSGELHGARFNELLSGVLSTRIYLKQANHACENKYVSYSEPANALAWLFGYPYPHGYIWHGWRWLLQNQPHDSICGCSVDQVHEEMETRFSWAKGIADVTFHKAALFLASLIDVKASKDTVPLYVFNPNPWPWSPVIDVLFKFSPLPGDEGLEICPAPYNFHDESGTMLPAQNRISKAPARYSESTYVHYLYSVQVKDVPAFGYKVIYMSEDEEEVSSTQTDVKVGDNYLENDKIKIDFTEKGTLDIVDKATGELYEGQMVLVDDADAGDEYDYSWIADDAPISSKDAVHARVYPVQKGPARGSIEIHQVLPLPAKLLPNHKARSDEIIEQEIVTTVSITPGSPVIEFRTVLDNKVEDHRLRVRFQTGVQGDTVHADGHFTTVDRTIGLPDDSKWSQRAQGTHHVALYIDANDGTSRGLAVINKGLPEYEAKVEDGAIVIYQTLFRAIGWLSRGDMLSRNHNAGPNMEAPGAQCKRHLVFEYAMMVHAGETHAADVPRFAREFVNPAVLYENIGKHERAIWALNYLDFNNLVRNKSVVPESKSLPESKSFIQLESTPRVHMAIFKKAEHSDEAILRLYNPTHQEASGSITLGFDVASAGLRSLEEKEITDPDVMIELVSPTSITFTIPANKIVTIGLKPAQ
jgi:mannosylglycerate hydrolase